MKDYPALQIVALPQSEGGILFSYTKLKALHRSFIKTEYQVEIVVVCIFASQLLFSDPRSLPWLLMCHKSRHLGYSVQTLTLKHKNHSLNGHTHANYRLLFIPWTLIPRSPWSTTQPIETIKLAAVKTQTTTDLRYKFPFVFFLCCSSWIFSGPWCWW